MPVEGSVRDRRRAETVAEIKDAALRQLAEAGPGGMSLRGVARAVGMTVQSLYHYFDSRDALLTVLVLDGHHALADAVQQAADATRGGPHLERLLAATQAYRSWALANRSAFLLLYGTAVPDYEMPADGPDIEAATRLAAPFLEVVFDGWTAEQIDAVALLPGAERIAGLDPSALPLPPGAMALFYELRARMHGLVMLDLLGHLAPLGAVAEELFGNMVARMAAELAVLRDGP